MNTSPRLTPKEEAQRERAIAEARSAAERVTHISSEAFHWAKRSAVGADDAADTARAAGRAWCAVQEAERSATVEEARAAARAACAALASAEEADARLVSAIADSLTAA